MVDAHNLPFRVEVWDEGDNRVEEVVALVGDHAVVRAAFAQNGCDASPLRMKSSNTLGPGPKLSVTWPPHFPPPLPKGHRQSRESPV